MDDIDMMSGFEFKEMGYQSVVTKVSGDDQGIDVIVVKIGVKTGIQQEVVAGIKYYNLHNGMVIKNRYFTNSAMTLAESNEVVLWDRAILEEKVKNIHVIGTD